MYALVNCNNFYVSCERVFAPRLDGRPVVVLSNNDECLISRSDKAKALSLKMGEPYHLARLVATGVSFRAADGQFRPPSWAARSAHRITLLVGPNCGSCIVASGHEQLLRWRCCLWCKRQSVKLLDWC